MQARLQREFDYLAIVSPFARYSCTKISIYISGRSCIFFLQDSEVDARGST